MTEIPEPTGRSISIKDMCNIYGMQYRNLDYYCRNLHLHDGIGRGKPRLFNAEEATLLILIDSMLRLGKVSAAIPIARELTAKNQSFIRSLPDGKKLTMQISDEWG